jgi:hypothetical protein
MRRIIIGCSCLVFVLAACGSDKNRVSSATTTAPGPTVTSTTRPAPTSTSAATTTSEACPDSGPTDPRSTPAGQPAALLTGVAVTNVGCLDRVTFAFEPGAGAGPSCRVEYRAGPFTQDGSGKPIAVAGSAFVSVRCEPAYGFDFATGTATYTGPKRITGTGTRHVREVVETGDYEAVLNWVIGLDARRSFEITASGSPGRQLVVTFS